jgi:uncharacterized repeat protein (TIGR01451 family)
VLFAFSVILFPLTNAHADIVTRFTRLTGNYNYVVTGGSLRTQSNAGNPCTIGGSNTQTLSGIPVGATRVAAYLYWGGSGATDANVSLNGSSVTASRTFTSTMTDGTGRVFFGGFADVSSLITSNGAVTFSNLTVDVGGQYCSTATVLAGWSLVVVYSSSSEPLRAINIFDGLDTFFNSSLSLTPNGFRIPTTGIDGKMTAITWEGDDDLGGGSEILQFNGNTIDTTGYDSNSHFSGVGGTTTYGVDVDTYNISSFLSAGATSASTFYSAGGDRVFLAAQIISVTSEPQVDLSITKTHSGNFTVGTNATYTLHVANAAGVQQVDYLTTVTDVLPAGLTFVSGTGTGWSCSAAGQTVTCTHAAPLSAGAAFPDIALNVAVGNAAFPSISNTVSVVTAGSNDFIVTNNSATDTATVLGPNLTTSTKTVSDLNAGDANPGDTLRYTITIIETAGVAATGVAVTDDMPGNVSGFSVVSIPLGAVNGSSGAGTGANGNGLLNVSNISVPANGSATIVFDVQVAAGTSPGAFINNTASINNPAGTDPTPSAPQIIVSQSQIPGAGTKQLYLWSSPANRLSRLQPTGTHGNITINGANGSSTWTILPSLQQAVTLQVGGFPVQLILQRTGSSTGNGRNVTVALTNSTLGTLATASNTVPAGGASIVTFNLALAAPVTAPAGSTFSLVVTNTTTTNTRTVDVTPYTGSTFSMVQLNSASVITVNSVNTYSAAYPANMPATSFLRGVNTVYLRAVVADPFGSFDISAANITLINSANVTIVNAATMTQVADSGTATKTYEFAYAVPSGAVVGAWTARVVANEGVEGITDLGVGSFTVTAPMPTLQISKISEVLSDPVNGTSNPKRIPLSVVRYTITVTNTGPGAVDANSLIVTDVIPADAAMFVDGSGGNPVEFIDGSTSSGLTFNYASNVTYSSAPGGGVPFTYAPTSNANGVDLGVTGVRIAPTGTMPGASGVNQPSFVVRFRVKVK